MREAIDSQTDDPAIDDFADDRPPASSDTPTIWLVGDDASITARVRAAVPVFERAYDIVVIEQPTRLMAAARPPAPVLCCLTCGIARDDTYRAVALLRKLAAGAPILLIDAGDSGLDLASVMAAGAWDCVRLDDDVLLEARLKQALELGRSRYELSLAQERLNKAQRRLDVLQSEGSDARARIVGRQITQASAAFARLVGADDVAAVQARDLLTWVQSSDRQAVANALAKVASDGVDTALVFHLEDAGIGIRGVRALLRPASTEASAAGDSAVDLVLQKTDDARGRVFERARGAPADGRMALHNVLAHTVGRAQEHVLGLIFIAVDEIEILQERFGLAGSDLLLQEVGLFLLDALQGVDRIFRFDAGEYVLLVERQSRDEISAAAQRIHAAFADEVFGDEPNKVNLAVSATHIVLAGDAAENDRRLRRIVDSGYDLRAGGGNACRDCSEADVADGEPMADGQWSQRLQQALAQDRFSLAYQGITSLAGDSQPYFDVLLRYIDDRGALVRPGEFLAAAEATGLMPEIDRWVARRAVAVIAQQRAYDIELALFVKLSKPTIKAGGEFLRWLAETMTANESVPRHCLIFSFREDDVRAQARAAKTLAAELDAQGFRVALTHFGSTPKSGQALDDLPVSFVKLAPDFAKDVAGNSDDRRLQRVIAHTQAHKIPLIAEQIEDANSMARLWQAGVNYVQGHFIQEPDTEALAHSDKRLL